MQRPAALVGGLLELLLAFQVSSVKFQVESFKFQVGQVHSY